MNLEDPGLLVLADVESKRVTIELAGSIEVLDREAPEEWGLREDRLTVDHGGGVSHDFLLCGACSPTGCHTGGDRVLNDSRLGFRDPYIGITWRPASVDRQPRELPDDAVVGLLQETTWCHAEEALEAAGQVSLVEEADFGGDVC